MRLGFYALAVLVSAAPVSAASGPAKTPARAAKKLAPAAKKLPPAPAAKPARLKAPAARELRPAALRLPVLPPTKGATLPALVSEAEAPSPAEADPDRDRVLRLQEALHSIVHGPVLGRLRVGVRVMDLDSGRLLFGRGGSALMDPASNQKVLATATALLRLGNAWRFSTELSGAMPDADGAIGGDVVLRGSGDPSLRISHLQAMADALARRGVVRIDGGIYADTRRIGSDEATAGERSPLRVGGAAIELRVRPGGKEGARPAVSVLPASDAFIVDNRAVTRGKGKSKVSVALAMAGGRIRVTITGRIAARHPGLVIRRAPPGAAFYAALLMRDALVQSGIEVRGPVGVVSSDRRPRQAARPGSARTLFASGATGADVTQSVPLWDVLAVHRSEPLPVIIRRINKDSDNEWAERLLESVGAEVYGGAATASKGLRALREAVGELGLPPSAYVPTNGSGLGHGNRITPDAMAELLRTVFLDPRIGPDLLQSLSVGGVDGTTRNRFRDSPAAQRVRAKTGTLRGKSILSGYVGDGTDVLVFSIFVQGMRPRAVASVRAAQVGAVNAMMRYVRGAEGPTPGEEVTPGRDFEVGEELIDSEMEEADDEPPPSKEKLDEMIQRAVKQVGLPGVPEP